jgi:hypothetical protein
LGIYNGSKDKIYLEENYLGACISIKREKANQHEMGI